MCVVYQYTHSRAERIAAQAGHQARVNKLVSMNGEGGRERDAELTPAVQQLCRNADAFVLVVNACHVTEEGIKLLLNFRECEFYFLDSPSTEIRSLDVTSNASLQHITDHTPPGVVMPTEWVCRGSRHPFSPSGSS